MKRLCLLSLLVLGCSSPTSESITPEFEPGHALPHATDAGGNCHTTIPATETQGHGGALGQCVAIN
jgi:hypothetical protein